MKKNNKNLSEKNHKGAVVWFTGLSQSGKSTVADGVYEVLKNRGLRVERLDGDIVRQSLTRDLGFSKEDRDKNIERVGFVAKLLSRNSVIVLASFISPYRHHRDGVRKEVDNFIEVFCNCPLEICEKRDGKGQYEKARRGEIQNFTGISDPYEEPENPDVELRTHELSIKECIDEIIDHLKKRLII